MDEVITSTPEVSATPAQTESAPTAPVEQPFLTIKHLKEEKALSRDEAQTLAQKGMDYDFKVKKLEETIAENKAMKDKYSWLDEVENPREVFESVSLNNKVQQFLYEHPEVDEEIATQLVREQQARLKAEKDANRLREPLERAEKEQRVRGETALQFCEDNGLKYDEIPQEVIDKWLESDPSSLPHLYDKYQLNETKKEIEKLRKEMSKVEEVEKAREQKQQNAEATIGSIGGSNEADISTMSEEQLETLPKDFALKHQDAVWNRILEIEESKRR